MKNILIIGDNDAASACALRLFRAGFSICMVGWKTSFDLFSFRNFSLALQQGSKSIENVKALSFADFIFHNTSSIDLSINHFIEFTVQNREISILSEDDISLTDFQMFTFCVNCNDDLFEMIEPRLRIPIISCGEEEKAQADYYVGTSGNYLGRVKYPFLELKDEHKYKDDRIFVYSPVEGVFIPEKYPGDFVKKNEKIATIGQTDIFCTSSGYILGAVNSGVIIAKDKEIFCIARNPITGDISEIPPKYFSIAGGVLEAILFHSKLNISE